MKRIISLLLIVLIHVSSVGQSNEEYLRTELERIEDKLHNYDTMGVREALESIATQCDTSQDWIVQFKYNQLYGGLELMFCKSEASSILYFRRAYDIFPTDVAANSDFMEVADFLACAYEETMQYDSAERVASEALLRGSTLGDSIPYAAGLFAVLADCYQQRGDTIMPKYFHQKSQLLSMLHEAYTSHPDSIELVYHQFYTMNNLIEQQRVFFTKDHPAYLFLLSQYLGWVANTGNVDETIWLGEQVLHIARDSSLDVEPQLFEAYIYLLYAYACSNKMDKCENLLPDAKRCFSAFSKHPNKDGVLYYYIACGLMDDIRHEEAINYLKLAKNRMDKDHLKKYRQDISYRLSFCNEKVGLRKKNSKNEK